MKFLVFMIIVYVLNTFESKNLSSCRLSLPDGVEVNFSQLRNKFKDYSLKFGKKTYFANFCGALINKCKDSQGSASLTINSNKILKIDECTSLSKKWTPKLNYIHNVNKSVGLRITMPEGDKCQTIPNTQIQISYVLNCDMSKDIEFTNVMKSNKCRYEYHFNSKYGCYTTHMRLYPTSNIPLIVMILSLIIIYFAGFTYMNLKENPNSEITTSIPNVGFWKRLCSGTKFILNWLFEKVRRKNNRSSLDNY